MSTLTRLSVATLLALLPLAPTSLAQSPAPRPPNILLILIDDMGYGDLGCYGGTFAPTPHIDRLAAQGIRFTQYYSASPICSPSRTGLTTGQYPARWNITSFLQTRAGNRACEQADYLDPKAPSLARALKAAGYATGHFGKWHMGGGRDVVDAPRFAAYGFDAHASTWESPQPHPDITGGDWIWGPKDTIKRPDRTAFFVDQALAFLKQHKDRPCYINLWPDDVHDPYVPLADRLNDYNDGNLDERKFRAVLDELDRQIGRLMTGIKDLGLDDNTLILFTSDNGAKPNFRDLRNGGLRGTKLSLYEGGIKMPFIVRWPGHVPAGKVDPQSVLAAVDLFPTLCALAGAPLPADYASDGLDVGAVLKGQPFSRPKALLWEYGRNNKSFAYPKKPHDRSPNLALRDGQWKLLISADGTGAGTGAGPADGTIAAPGTGPELYDLEADPKETTDLAAKHPDRVKEMSARVLAWRKSLPRPR